MCGEHGQGSETSQYSRHDESASSRRQAARAPEITGRTVSRGEEPAGEDERWKTDGEGARRAGVEETRLAERRPWVGLVANVISDDEHEERADAAQTTSRRGR